MKPSWVLVLIALVAGLVGGYCFGSRKPEAQGIERRADALVRDSLPIWRAQDEADSIAIAQLTELANAERTRADEEQTRALRIKRERDSLRVIAAGYQREVDSAAADAPPEAQDYSHAGVRFWQTQTGRYMRLAAQYKLEADLANQGDHGFLGTITRLKNEAAYNQKKMGRLQAQVDRVTAERDQAVATIDTLRTHQDCSGPLGIPCPELGVGLGITYGYGSASLPPKPPEVTVGATVAVYIPVKQIRW